MIAGFSDGVSFHIDGFIHKDLKFVREKVLSQIDMFICIIDGRPGSGKSTLGAQMAYFLSKGTMTLKHECFSAAQFEEACRDAKPGDAIVVDECFDLANKRRTQTSENMKILSLLQVMRSRRVFILLLLPSIFDLDKGVILNLCDLFFHTYRSPFGPRGQCTVYDRFQLKKLWLYNRQSMSYDTKFSKPTYRAKFVKTFPLDMAEYEKKKYDSLMKATEDKQSEYRTMITQRNKVITKLRDFQSVTDICGVSGMKRRAVYNILKDGKESDDDKAIIQNEAET